MEIELQSIPLSNRSQYHTRHRSAKESLQSYKKLLADSRIQLTRAELFSSSNGGFTSTDDPYAASNDRTRLLSGTDILEQGTKRLQQSQQLALETETQGAEILTNLRTQREQIENSRGTVGHIPSSVSLLSTKIKHSASTSGPCH